MASKRMIELIAEIISESIFDRLDSLENTIKNLGNDYLSTKCKSINNADLNEQFGKVIIAYGNSCLNRPSGLNGYLINIPHDNRPTVYNKQIWITRPNNNIYIRNMDNSVWGDWQPLHYDTGWLDMTLANGIANSNADRPAQYRRINNTVYIRGGVKGINARGKLIATLPNGYRPKIAVYYVQNMSNNQDAAAMTRMQIKTDGQIMMQYNTNGGNYDANSWYNLETSFLID